MLQDEIFGQYEGDNWYKRNSVALDEHHENDAVIKMIKALNLSPKSILEVGCSNGWRLEKLSKLLNPRPERICGRDISHEAIAEGTQKWGSDIELKCEALDDLKAESPFDLLICSFVLHWIDRKNLMHVISNIDRALAFGGGSSIRRFSARL